MRPRAPWPDPSQFSFRGGFALPFLLLLFLGAGQAALQGCAPAVVASRQLLPDPRWLQAGNQVVDGFLVGRLEGMKVEVRVKYLPPGELLRLLNASSGDPHLFDPSSPELGAFTPFLLSISNQGSSPLILEVQHAQLQGSRGDRLYSLEYADIYEIFSQDKEAERKVKVVSRLLLRPSPILAQEVREGLLLFGPLDAKAKGAMLKLSLLAAGRPLQSHTCIFPFAVEPLSYVPGGTGSGGPS